MSFKDLHEIGEMFRELEGHHTFLPGYSYVGRPISARVLLAKLQEAHLDKLTANRSPRLVAGGPSPFLDKPIEVSITPVRHAPKCGTYRDTSARRRYTQSQKTYQKAYQSWTAKDPLVKPKCSRAGCNGRKHARSLCHKHYQDTRKEQVRMRKILTMTVKSCDDASGEYSSAFYRLSEALRLGKCAGWKIYDKAGALISCSANLAKP